MFPRRFLLPAALAVGIATVVGPRAGLAYDFEVRARTIGQGYQLRSLRFGSPSLTLSRLRLTQTLSLDIWDLAGRTTGLEPYQTPRPGGPNFYFTGYLRFDHDFGNYMQGQIAVGSQVFDAVDLIPELSQQSHALDLLYGYFAAEGLWGGRLDLYAGRQLEVDTLDFFSMDGVTARVHTPWSFSAEAFGGLRVRDAFGLGSAVYEPDGTAGSECREYVEGPAAGSGSWRPIDRSMAGEPNPFAGDFGACPQREKLMPTFGGALETRGLPWLHARVAYRRSVSPTPGVIADANRGRFPDVGYYPNESGQAPSWGVNEEFLSATVRAPLKFLRGRFELVPYAAARYSFLHGLLDEAHAGTHLRYGAHSLEPELFYSFPTFDGDSIFNVFSTEPYTDARVTYGLDLKPLPWKGYVRGWARRYESEDAATARPVAGAASKLAGGVQVGARFQRLLDQLGRLDLFYDDGYGGRRTGGFASARWRLLEPLVAAARVGIIDFDEDLRPQLDGVSYSLSGGGTYLIRDGIAVSLLAEENLGRVVDSHFRLFAILDLAYSSDL